MTILISNRSRCAVPTCETSDEQAGSQRIGRAAALSRPSAFAPPVRPLPAARQRNGRAAKGWTKRPLFPQKRLQRLLEPSGRDDAFLHPGKAA